MHLDYFYKLTKLINSYTLYTVLTLREQEPGGSGYEKEAPLSREFF